MSTEPEPVVTAVIYCRVSTRYQEPNGSLQEQETHARTYCARRDITVLRVIHEVYDNDDMESRPLLNEVTEMAVRGEFDLLIADKVDRFSRADPRETDFFIMTLERLGVKTVVLDADQTGDPDIDDILFFFKKWKAKREKRDTTERTQRGRMRRLTGQGRKRGVLVGPHPLYGYVWDDPQKLHRYALVRDPESAQWVVWMFERAAEGWDSARIAQELNRLHVPTIRRYYQAKGLASPLLKASDVWRPRVVREIIQNDDYLGKRVAFKTQWQRHSGRKIQDRETGRTRPAKYSLPRAANDPKRLDQEGLCEPLVDEALAMKARAYLAEYRDGHSYRRENPTTPTGDVLPDRMLAGGFMLCGHCGAHMIGVSSGARKWFERRYLCRRHRVFINGETVTDCPGGSVSITGDAFEQVVWWVVVKILTDGTTLPEAIARLRSRADDRVASHTKKREALREAIARCEETTAVNNRLMVASARQDERFAETKQFGMWRLEVQQAEDDIAGYEREIAKLDAEEAPMERHLQVLDRLVTRQHNEAMVTLLSFDVEGKRQLLREMNLRVIVWNKASKPRWGIRIDSPDSPLVVTAQLAPTAAITNEGPTAEIVPDGMAYQHYIWHEIAGRVAQLLVAYGEEGQRATDQPDEPAP